MNRIRAAKQEEQHDKRLNRRNELDRERREEVGKTKE